MPPVLKKHNYTSEAYHTLITVQFICLITIKTRLTLQKSWSASCSTLALSTQRIRLWTTGSDSYTLFTTANDTSGVTMVCAWLTTTVVLHQVEQETISTFGGGYDCGNRISDDNVYIAYHSNYWSILLSFWDMMTAYTPDRPTSASISYPADKAGSN